AGRKAKKRFGEAFMRATLAAIAGAGFLIAAAGGLAADKPSLPLWAFATNPPGGGTPAPDDGSQKSVPNSPVRLTLTQVRDVPNTPDGHPDNHPPMPDAVKHGRGDLFGCGYCHLPNGQGRPENAGLAGLPAAYIEQQVADFRNGARKSSDDKAIPSQLM